MDDMATGAEEVLGAGAVTVGAVDLEGEVVTEEEVVLEGAADTAEGVG